MNPCIVTIKSGAFKETKAEVIANWHDGNEFRVYHYATMISVADSNRLMKAGFTHVRVVWQRADLCIMYEDIELKVFKPN